MIDPATARFLEEGLSIHLATRNARLEPEGARVLAAVVEPDGEHLVIYLPEIAADRVLTDLAHNGQAAVVFGRPTDDRSCQVKGTFVSVRPAHASDRTIIDGQRQAMLDVMAKIGIPPQAFLGWATWPAVAVRLRATAVFEQTPGPRAGERLS